MMMTKYLAQTMVNQTAHSISCKYQLLKIESALKGSVTH